MNENISEQNSLISDEELVKKIQKGESKFFEVLVKKYEKKNYNLIYRIIKNDSISSDILQDTFLKAYRSLKNFKGKSKFSTWLYRIAINFCLMHKRKKDITVSLDTPLSIYGEENIKREIPDWSMNPLLTTENEELKKKIYSAINMLQDDYRTALVLKDIDGLSNKEVGNILNISIPAVKSRIHRARLFLRDKLSEYITK